MEKYNKRICFFSDLEGTLIPNLGGTYKEEEFKNFLTEIQYLGELLHAEIDLRIISPMEAYNLNKHIDNVDRSIFSFYNNTNKDRIIKLKGAATIRFNNYLSNEDSVSFFHHPKIDSRIVEYNSQTGVHGSRMKEEYINDVLQYNSKNTILFIYAGDGLNDSEAMKALKEKEKNTIIIAPANSADTIKEISTFVSDKKELLGITDCLKKINERTLSIIDAHKPSDIDKESDER